MKDLCEIKYGKSIEANKLTNNYAYKVYGGNGIIGTLETFEHKSYKIAISCRGAASGNVIITEPYSTISSNSLYLNLYDNNNLFDIYLFLKNANLNNITTGSAQPQITIANIQDLSVNIYSHSYNDLLEKLLNTKTCFFKKNEELNMLKQYYLKKFFG